MLDLYRLLTWLILPFLPFWQWVRCRMDKEDETRWKERYGITSTLRPLGRVLWFHAASIGESLALLPLIERLLAEHPEASAVVTTGTRTSAALLAERLPARALHQYVPYDTPYGVARFLEHWRPCIAFWSESELWPNLLLETHWRCPVLLLNGRISEASTARWEKSPQAIRRLLGCFSLILAKGEEDAARLRRLGALLVETRGDLKLAAEPLQTDAAELEDFRTRLSGRPHWLAASTHPREEAMIAEAHRLIARDHPQLVTLIVPRHARRGDEVASELRLLGFRVSQRSAAETIGPETEIYLADTTGELGIYYRLCDIAFIGGSLVPHGGQNPLEAARLDTAILYGPHMENFSNFCSVLEVAGAARRVPHEAALAHEVGMLLDDPAHRTAMASAATLVAQEGGGVLESIAAAIEPFVMTALRPNAPRPIQA